MTGKVIVEENVNGKYILEVYVKGEVSVKVNVKKEVKMQVKKIGKSEGEEVIEAERKVNMRSPCPAFRFGSVKITFFLTWCGFDVKTVYKCQKAIIEKELGGSGQKLL